MLFSKRYRVMLLKRHKILMSLLPIIGMIYRDEGEWRINKFRIIWLSVGDRRGTLPTGVFLDGVDLKVLWEISF